MDKRTQNFGCNFNGPIDLVDKVKKKLCALLNGQGKE
jgi:hypothetical protein